MALNCTVLTSGYSATAGTVFTTASISPAANALIEIEILGGDGGSDARVPDSVTGASLTFDNVVGVLNDGTYNYLNKRRAMSASPGSGVVTITFPIVHEACGWIIKEWTGVDTSGTNGSGAIVQSASNFQNTPLVTTGSVTLAGFGSADNAVSACFSVNKIGAITNEAGYTELADFEIVGWDTRLQSEWKIGEDTSPSCTWDVAGKYGGLAVEIKAGGRVLDANITQADNTLAATLTTGRVLNASMMQDGNTLAAIMVVGRLLNANMTQDANTLAATLIGPSYLSATFNQDNNTLSADIFSRQPPRVTRRPMFWVLNR